MVVAAMLLRRSPMSFRSLIVVFGSLLMHIFRHGVSLVIWGRSSVTIEALDSSKVRLKLWGPRLFFSALNHCLHSNVRRPTPCTVHRFDQSDRSLPLRAGHPPSTPIGADWGQCTFTLPLWNALRLLAKVQTSYDGVSIVFEPRPVDQSSLYNIDHLPNLKLGQRAGL